VIALPDVHLRGVRRGRARSTRRRRAWRAREQRAWPGSAKGRSALSRRTSLRARCVTHGDTDAMLVPGIKCMGGGDCRAAPRRPAPSLCIILTTSHEYAHQPLHTCNGAFRFTADIAKEMSSVRDRTSPASGFIPAPRAPSATSTGGPE